uniref:Beta-ketoacyl-[acyl-carrier-protein] synthase III n=1 Tax=Streptomyces lividans TaxID=1916 RepID=FABH_STRLI|nr:RecName: Full=Beta-ketoacyl-[acyl-carrier-protein] synthase III; Short=Beta-ketoacyl-ACP synthase III; Short=KAS III; AltName: Full=3-oxoacyl-[acyl-carrier-protein] synthase 3; AltName: Full=3-oxoacyl-[acyl-carrier-protein] synthase III; AltName: Full=Branched-chain beta-ketoacyl-[acyl-carrier-protein] synthase [Streptomyces lividans]AAG30195.1 beta-ketoacylsynthase III [Streptomyces sp. R1128]1MZJ_A Chain A, Beta-ketoacylsynthase III [Streptomyces sp. R1128]1MZJ_B Chain B, Beta-ketoacylsynth
MPGLRVPERRFSRVLGVGSYRPRREVSNKEVCTWIDSTEEWIETRTGIRSRRIAEPDETIQVMGVAASRRALEHAGVDPAEIDLVVVSTMTNFVHTPPLSVAIAHELGADNAGGFDLSAACAGFCHALSIAADAVESGGSRHVLVVATERMTDVIDLADRSLSFLFGDGAGAAVVGPSDVPGIGPVVRGIDGTGLGSLHMSSSWDQYVEDPSVGRPALVMDGKRVFRWAVADVVPAAREALEVAGLTVGDLVAFVPHQANLRIIDVLVDRLGVPEHVVVSRDAEDTGNTSSASVALALDRLVRSGAVPGGGPALMIGFGAGLSYAGQALLLPDPPSTPA